MEWLQTFQLLLPRPPNNLLLLLLVFSPVITKHWIFGHSERRRVDDTHLHTPHFCCLLQSIFLGSDEELDLSEAGGGQSVEDSDLVKSMFFEERWQSAG